MRRAPFSMFWVVPVLLLGCATAVPQRFEGTSGNIAWRLADLRIEEREAGPPGRGGRAITWRYTIVLRETQGTGVTFDSVDLSYLSAPTARISRKAQPLNLTLPPRGELRVAAWDSDWLVVPQDMEGTAQSRTPSGVATRVFSGTSDRGQPVRLTMEFRPHLIPPGAQAPRSSTPAAARTEPPAPAPADPRAGGDLLTAFFGKEQPQPGKVYRSDGSDFPPRFQVFDADADPRVVFTYIVKTATRVFHLRTDWYDPSGALFETFTRTLDLTRGTTMNSVYTANVLPTDRMRDYPGTWAVKVTIDDRPAGEYGFDLRSSSAASRSRPTVTADLPPSVSPGQRWILSVGALELDRIEGDVYVYKLGSDRAYHRTRDGKLIRVVVGGETLITYDPPFPHFEWPLEVGKRWFYEGRVTNKLTGFDGKSRSTIRVLAYEDVDTPAGRFKAFKLSTGPLTYWYSPEVGTVVKSITTNPSTIVDYTLVMRNVEGRASATAEASRPAGPEGRPLRPEDLRPYYGDSWAVVVGIDRYGGGQIQRLNYAVADARAIAAMLPALGFAPDRITVLENAKATKLAVEQALYGSLTSMGNDDRLFVFFAGHGVSHAIKGGAEGYLLTADASLDNLPLTALAMRDLAQIGRRLPAKHIVFILDTCFSGYAASRDVVAPRPGAPDLLSLTREPVVQILTAGTQDQRVFEDKGHGIFTKHLLKGLEGWADPEGTGLTTVKLAAYIQERVLRESGGAQTPQYGKLDGEGEFLFRPPR